MILLLRKPKTPRANVKTNSARRHDSQCTDQDPAGGIRARRVGVLSAWKMAAGREDQCGGNTMVKSDRGIWQSLDRESH